MHLILQKKINGVTNKVWKLNAKKSVHVAGSSRKADLYLPTIEYPVWMGFEYRDNTWYVLNLAGESSNSFIEQQIQSPIELNCKDFQLEVFPMSGSFDFISEPVSPVNQTSAEEGVLLLNSVNGRITGSGVLPLVDFQKKHPYFIPSQYWQKSDQTNSQTSFFYKLTPLHNQIISELRKEPKEQDKNARYLQALTLFTLCLGLSFYLLLPSEKGASEVALSSVPPKILMREAKVEPKKKTQPQKAQGGMAASTTQTNTSVKQASGQSAFGNSSRIAQMIARISNQNPTSKNLVIVKNAKIGDPSGTLSPGSMVDQSGGSAKGLGLIGGSTTGVQVGTLSNQTGSGSGRGLAALTKGVSGSGGQAAADALDEEADVEGGLDPEVIANFIKSKLGEVLYCYERQLAANPHLYGKVGVKFIIGATGLVESSRVFQSTLQNASVEGCVTQKISRWRFPTPRGGTQVVVTYPFLFKNTN